MISKWRDLAERDIDGRRRERIKRFYRDEFHPKEYPELKFRYIKLFTYNERTKTYQWNYLHRSVRKRSFNARTLKDSIVEIIDRGIVPIRLFMSAALWLYPYRIRGIKSKVTRYMSPGIVPIECDTTLEDSIEVASLLHEKMSGRKIQVYTGNRSIHTWLMEFERSPQSIEEDLLLRKEIFDRAQSTCSQELDRRTTVDTFRVVPILGSCNGFTMRKVVEWEMSMGAEELLEAARIE